MESTSPTNFSNALPGHSRLLLGILAQEGQTKGKIWAENTSGYYKERKSVLQGFADSRVPPFTPPPSSVA